MCFLNAYTKNFNINIEIWSSVRILPIIEFLYLYFWNLFRNILWIHTTYTNNFAKYVTV